MYRANDQLRACVARGGLNRTPILGPLIDSDVQRIMQVVATNVAKLSMVGELQMR
jgi:hypothetical protein